MKKLVLKKRSDAAGGTNYRLNYEQELNASQYEAVMHQQGAALVIAGAGTGKTRTLIYRVARLVEDGISPEQLLLLTFTRKSSQEMLRRASMLLDGRCERVSGGTFHSFAHSVLRRYSDLVGYARNFGILDQGDAEDAVNFLRASKKLDASKRRFPNKKTFYSIASASVNRCIPVREIVETDYPQFSSETEEIEQLIRDFHGYKIRNNVMDYDDLLLYLAKLLTDDSAAKIDLRRRFKHVMVDEYQDTNSLQHQIVCALAAEHQNVMAVGDDAQSIYSFRGANFENIMRFPESFRSCRIITIEENFRSTKQILDLSNAVISAAAFRYEKTLYSTNKLHGEKPAIVCAREERMQSEFVVQQILELRESGVALKDIAVLFRSGFMSFDLEIELTKANIPFVKYGGLKLLETQHVKDVLALVRVIMNVSDMISWMRVLLMLDGVGQRTAAMIVERLESRQLNLDTEADVQFVPRGREAVADLFAMLRRVRDSRESTADKLSRLCEYYRPILKEKQDDFAKRWKDLEMLCTIAASYDSMESFLSDMALEPPEFSVADLEAEGSEREFLTLSTIHSAKGLEWDTVFVLTVLEGRFPSSRAVESIDSLEEERRLMYVATTRAKNRLFLSYPLNIFDRESGTVLSQPSRFLEAVPDEFVEHYVLAEEEQESPLDDLLLPPAGELLLGPTTDPDSKNS